MNVSIPDFQELILQHYKNHGRDFPWRNTNNPYHIMVSEFMLQQTQTERVIDKYLTWIEHFPSIEDLANAAFAEVLSLWLGLGYNRRARFLHECAKKITDEYKGSVPTSVEVLQTLPGIGPYTANAIACFAYNYPCVFIETNIRTVFIFFFFRQQEQVHDSDIMPLVEKALYEKNPRLWYYALMDYGALLKKKTQNPNRKSSHYTKQSRFDGSLRQARGALLRKLVISPLKKNDCMSLENLDAELLKRALHALVDEGFVCERDGMYYIA